MTNKERLVALSILVSVFGFAFISAVNPIQTSNSYTKPFMVVASEYITHTPIFSESSNLDFDSVTRYERKTGESSRMVSMLSTVLEISSEDIEESLRGGVRPSEMLASSGIYLSDLAEEFNFEIVGERGLVKFRA